MIISIITFTTFIAIIKIIITHSLTIIINITAMQSVSSSFKGDTMGVLRCQLLIASKQSPPCSLDGDDDEDDCGENVITLIMVALMIYIL